MQKRTIEIFVGAFMLAGIISLLFLAVRVSGFNVNANKNDSYTLYARFSNASGLAVRAQVTVAGVVIGRVNSIALDPKDNRAKVEMVIQKDVNYLTLDSIAAIQTQGVLGEKYISIAVGGDPELLKSGGEIVDTQSALVIEDLIGKMLTSMANKKD